VRRRPLTNIRDLLRRLLAVTSGAILYGLAFPPYDLAGLAWLALVPLLLIVRGRSTFEAFLTGLAYGFACSATVAGWLAPTMARFFQLPVLFGQLAAAFYALTFWGTAFGLFAAGAARLLASHRPTSAALAIAALWVGTELLRGRVLGQPWCLLGYSQHADVALIQLSTLTAVYGVSFLVALGNAAIADAIALPWTGQGSKALRPLLLTAVLVAAAWIGGAVVVPGSPTDGTLPVAIVQTNVPPAVRWTRAYTDRQLMEHSRMTDEEIPARSTKLIVWPENAVPRYLEAEPGIAALLGTLARRHDSDLLLGAPRYEAGRTYNSVRLVTAAGRNGGHYDKQRLVLFAEANPLHPPESSGPDENPTQFTPGHGPGVLQSVVPLGVSVCHEVLFPDILARAVAAGAGLLVNVSNDGWLDSGTGVASRQHAAMAVFRAVETRRFLVRAATTGVSAVIDPYGRIVTELAPGATGVLHARVDRRTGMTPYARLGDAFALGCVAAAAAALSTSGRARGCPSQD
jgi:apolipoprotein N-acyltransferase